MSITSEVNRTTTAGNGVTTAFAYPTKFIASGDLTVILTDDTTKVETTQVITTHYTVSGAGDEGGGTVTMITAPASGETLTIFNDPAKTQELDLVENDIAPAEPKEDAYDKLTLICQRLGDLLDRSVTLSEGFIDTFDLTLPTDLATANTLIKVNATADGFAMGPTTIEIEDAETNATGAAASAAAAATSETNAATSETNAASSAASAAAQLASAFFTDVNFYTSADSPVTLGAVDGGKLHSFDSSGGAITVNLPEISAITLPLNYAFLLNTDGNDVTVNRGGASDLIATSTTKVLSVAGTGFQLTADDDPTPDRWSPLEFGVVADNSVSRQKLTTGAVANRNVTVETGTYTALTTDDLILCSGAAFTVTLPTAVGISGKMLMIKKTDSSLTNIITIDGATTETIDGNLTTTLNTENETLRIMSDGTNWQIINRKIPSKWGSNTPTINGFGTVTSNTQYSRRIGDTLHVHGSFTTGTPVASNARINIGLLADGDVTLDTSVHNAGTLIGHFIIGSNNESQTTILMPGTDQVYVQMGLGVTASNNPAAATNANVITASSGVSIQYQFKVPIVGWENT